VNKIGLVTSTNGLGHARRATYLALCFQEIGFQTIVFAGAEKIIYLKRELKSIGRSVDFIEIETYGVEGPVWEKKGFKIRKPSKFILNELARCRIIISDNAIWPTKYDLPCVLFGHFNWLNYWEARGKGNLPSRTIDLFHEESELIKKFVSSIQFNNFSLNGPHNPSKKISVGLLKYISDSRLPKNINKNIAWFANGTTRLNIISSLPKNGAFQYSYHETFKLIDSKEKPYLVVGRPGLGTIRDCMAAGILFVPAINDKDPELLANYESLRKLSLTDELNLSINNLDQISQMNYNNFADTWLNIWPQVSQNTIEVCAEILKFTP
jgi:hypothetical protein